METLDATEHDGGYFQQRPVLCGRQVSLTSVTPVTRQSVQRRVQELDASVVVARPMRPSRYHFNPVAKSSSTDPTPNRIELLFFVEEEGIRSIDRHRRQMVRRDGEGRWIPSVRFSPPIGTACKASSFRPRGKCPIILSPFLAPLLL